jgi:hypothetical protein
MPTMAAQHWNVGEIEVNFEIDLNSSAAIIATRGDDVVATKIGTGVYTVRVVGRTFYEVLYRHVHLFRAVPTIANAQITAIDLDGAGDGTGAVITITTLDDYATPVAADISSTAATLSGKVVFRGSKVS